MSGSDYMVPTEDEIKDLEGALTELLRVLRMFDYMSPESYRNAIKRQALRELVTINARKLNSIVSNYL